MQTKKISMLMAVLITASMILAEAASAAPEMFILEIQASGKGYEAIVDDTPVYIESKHKLDTFPLYALCDHEDSEIILAYYNAATQLWTASSPISIIVTDDKLLINAPSLTTVHIDSNATPVYSSGAMAVQFKEKDNTVTSGKLKSLAMSYWQSEQYGITGNLQRFGALKMKGKKVDWEDLPSGVKNVLD
jgi:hypothetical protein